MKAVTMFQKKVVEYSEKIPRITQKQSDWAKENCFKPKGFVTGKKVWCLSCGNVFEIQTLTKNSESCECPQCRKKLELQRTRKRTSHESWYFTMLTTFRGLQVCRHFVIQKNIYKVSPHIDGCNKPQFVINEVVQNWIDENGNEAIIARSIMPFSRYYDAWDYNKPMSLKKRYTNAYSYYPDRYYIDSFFVYPYKKILPIIKRNGYDGDCHGFAQSEYFRLILADREAEMLVKTKQFSILEHKYKKGCKEFGLPYQHAIRIANRNNYIVSDASLWYDYLDLLDYFHLDTHNAHYVCPVDLQSAHDKLLHKKRQIEEKIEFERKVKEAKKWEDKYHKAKEKYLGICFGNDNLVVTVIQSVTEMLEEGTRMHHCVFNMEYYKRNDSLILSVKNKQGERIETTEVNLKTFKIVQSRGVCNKNSEYHDSIICLINDNMNLIRKAS